MAKEKKQEARSEGNFATEKQKELIRQLYKETGYKRQYNEIEFKGLYNEEAQKHIDFLLGMKRGLINGGKNTGNVEGFNKIELGMIYKLCWRHYSKAENGLPTNVVDFQDMVLNEYLLYKDTVNRVKSAVEKKAGK